MRRVVAVLFLAVLVGLAAHTPAHAQTEPAPSAPVTSPAAVVEDQGDDEGGRPWARLLIFVPVSALIGAGAVLGRRAARDWGWIQS